MTPYETADVDELKMTLGLMELLDIDRQPVTDEDPLAAICRIVAQSFQQVKFAIYCRQDDFVWRDSYVEPGFKLHPNPPLVAKRFLKYVWKAMGDEDYLAIEHGEDLPFVKKEDMRNWECRSCGAIAVGNGTEREGVVVMFFKGNAKFDQRRCTWLKLMSAVVSRVACRDRVEREMQLRKLAAQKPTCKRPKFERWVAQSDPLKKIKAIVGVRGGIKSQLLAEVHRWLLAHGVAEDRIVSIDLESANWRHLKTARQVQAYLSRYPAEAERRYLLLDEFGNLANLDDLLRALERSCKWNVWFAASSRAAFGNATDEELRQRFATYLVWIDPRLPREDSILKRNWGWIFMRDAVCGQYHVDIPALEALAEYYSDHLGEAHPLREISAGLARRGRTLSPNTIAAYRRTLEASFLIEVSPIYDMAARHELQLPGRVFWTDLELRKWRFGKAQYSEQLRLKQNRLYLQLRRDYDHVYTPVDRMDEFMTIEADGSFRTWRT